MNAKLFTVFGGKFKFQGQNSDLEYFFGRFGDLTNPSHFLKKSHLYYYIIAGKAINFYFLIAAIFLIKVNKISKINNFFLL